ncbi:MAG: hypothetical protein R3D55_03480 [Chloroflexota bacterium]
MFDPKPVGQLQLRLPATSFAISQPEQTIVWLDEALPAGDFSVRGTAVLQQGSPDSGIGLALGGEENTFMVVVSPLGYVLVQQGDEAGLPWQPWPHVQPNNAPNEIWIDVRGDMLTVRLNRELLWQGAYPLATRRLGLVGEGFWGKRPCTPSQPLNCCRKHRWLSQITNYPITNYLPTIKIRALKKKWQSHQALPRLNLFHIHQFHIKDERGVGGNYPARTT